MRMCTRLDVRYVSSRNSNNCKYWHSIQPWPVAGRAGAGAGASESVQGAVYQQTRCDGWCRTIFYMFLLSKIFTWHQCHEYTHTLVHHLQNDSHKHPRQPAATRCSYHVDNVRMIIWDHLFCLGVLFDTLQFCREMFLCLEWHHQDLSGVHKSISWKNWPATVYLLQRVYFIAECSVAVSLNASKKLHPKVRNHGEGPY